MDNFEDNDIIIFINSYKEHILENPLLNSKIPIWVEYLKTKKYYKDNGLDEDYFFKKRFSVSNDDLIMIHKLIDRVKRGKDLTRKSKSNVQGSSANITTSSFSIFDENENYDNKNNQFELLGQVQDAMDSYYKKMKKTSKQRNWKKDSNYQNNSRNWEPTGSVADIPDRYYTEDINSHRPQVEFDVQDFAKTNMFNMNKTNIIQQIDNINNILNDNNLISNDFDTEYKRSVPNLSSKKKGQIINNIKKNENNQDPVSSRFWQDQDILSERGNTRNSCIPNKNPFEYQFQYLDGNYNRVPDPRLIGTSSRMENRTTFKR